MAKILLIEDSVEAQILIQKALPEHEIQTTRFYREALPLLESNSYDLVLLDLHLPDGSGYDICQKLKEGNDLPRIPVIMITGQSDVQDRIKGLNSGADDYVSKPFSTLELKARIESVLRRSSGRTTSNDISFGKLHIKVQEQKGFISTSSGPTPIDLTPVEFKILLRLSQAQEVVSRKELMSFVWGNDIHISPRNVDTHICKLRKKLEPAQLNIQNKRGRGYILAKKFVPPKVQPLQKDRLPHSL